MRKLSLVSVFALALLVAGCKSDEEKAISGSIDKMNEMTNVLKTIKDTDSAKAAAPTLQAIAKDLKEYQTKMKSMPPSEAEDKKLKEKYEAPMKEAMNNFMQEMMRVGMNPSLITPEVQEALKAAK